MRGRWKAAVAIMLLLILLPLTLLLTLTYWVPTLAGIWLPAGTRISLDRGPSWQQGRLLLPELRYLVGNCQLAEVHNMALSHPGRWRLAIDTLDLNSACLSKLPQSNATPAAPRTLAEWQAMLPDSSLTIDHLRLSPWEKWQGRLSLALTSDAQILRYDGDAVQLSAALKGQMLTIERFSVKAFDDRPPIKLEGSFRMPLVPDGLPVIGHIAATFDVPFPQALMDAELSWNGNQGQLIVMARGEPDPLLDLPWTLTRERLTISDGRWSWPWLPELPLSGRLGLRINNWQQGFDKMQVAGRLNVLTQGAAGKGNAVLNIGPGRLSMDNSAMPLQLAGEAKYQDLILYATLPAQLEGPLNDPHLTFSPGALLRSRGRIINALNIDQIRWPLAGVRVSRQGVDGRLQAILRAHEPQSGDFVLHLDGKASRFFPDSGSWRWRYWGDGHFLPLRARWDVKGEGEWRDSAIVLQRLSTGFDQLQYGSMTVSQPRLVLDEPVRWIRDTQRPALTGALSLDAGETHFSGGSVLPPSTLKFRIDGRDPTWFNFKGDLHAGAIGPVRVNGRWDGASVRGKAWWPQQSLSVFQPLLPPETKMKLRDGTLYAQVAFSAGVGQGFEAGGHGVVKNGSLWMPDNQLNDVDFILPFRFRQSTWQLGTRRPVSLRIGEIVNQITARNFTADLQGSYPWSEQSPLLLTDVSVELLGGKLSMLQLRMPQHDAALLRVNNISTSELISAVNPKQFAMSGPVNGALPLWLNNEKWIIKDGWLSNPGPMTLRVDKDTADAIVRDNMAAGSAINWLRYIEITRSWTKINLDNLGLLKLQAEIAGTSRVEGKTGRINLNYTHEENLFDLWRSLRFGDNLQAWLEQNAHLPASCQAGEKCKEQQ